jgi:uncharacterized protein YodC (DUF2158 family)
MHRDLTVGDVVMLKSGGPQMTVSDIIDMPNSGVLNRSCAVCKWFHGGDAHYGHFHPYTLTVVTEKLGN